MHIDDQTYQVKGRTYRRTLLRNSYRRHGKICHDTIANLSACSREEIAAIKLALANKNNLEALQVSGAKVKTRQGLSVGAVWLLYQLARRLGVVAALGGSEEAKRVLWLVIAAVLGSVSRLSATRLAQSHAASDILGLDSFCEDDLYPALDWLHTQQERIEDRLFQSRYQDRKPHLYLYDVTSSYLEGDSNELGRYGYNRDGKKGKKIIVVGLLTDGEGLPVSSEVFPGNTRDLKTFRNQVLKVAARFGLEEVTFVGDRGMIRSAQITDLSEAKFHYITALTKPEIETLLKKNILQMELFDENVCEVSDGGVRYVFRYNPLRREEIQAGRESKRASLQQFCAGKNHYLAEHVRAAVTVAQAHVQRQIERLKISDWLSVAVHGRQLELVTAADQLQLETKLDGCYVIKTDLTPTVASAQLVHDRYKDLAEVEWAFRTMKTTLLHLRGIFVRKAERTRAHVFTIMLAYLLAYELRRCWRDLEVTIDEGIAELASLCATEVVIGQVSIQTIPEPREMLRLLLQKAKVTLPEAIPCRHKEVLTRKKLVKERRTN
jgi:hypothetical protein